MENLLYVNISKESSLDGIVWNRKEIKEFAKEKVKQVKEYKKELTKDEYYSWLDREYKAIILLELIYWKEMIDVEAHIPFLLKKNVLNDFKNKPSDIEKNSEFYLYYFSRDVFIDWRYLKILNKLVRKIRKEISFCK